MGSVVRVPFGRRRAARGRRRACGELASCRPSASPSRSRRSRQAFRRSWSGSGSGSRASTARRPRAACSWCCPRAPARAAAGSARGSSCARRYRRRARRRLSGGGRLGVRQRAALEALARRRDVGAELAAAVGCRPPGAASPGGARPRSRPAARACAARPQHLAVGAADRSARAARRSSRRAVEEIVAALDGEADAPRELLLHGVTGSGKTEVYLAAVEAALERGRGAIVLVPEIGLAPQAVARFRARLGDRVAVLHSALSDGERYDEWRRLRSGEASVCVGPRSAVFAPVRDLGLLVIDEEHDPSYKQEGDPCYDARAVARRRAADMRRGARRRHRDAAAGDLAGAAAARAAASRRRRAPMPPVEVARHARRRPPLGPAAPGDLGGAGARSARDGAKAIVMINRRGFSPWLTCRSCGRHWGCPNCDVSLIVHRHSGRLVCHHCAHSEPLPGSCPECGSTTLSRAGAGTEQIEALLAERLGADAGLPARLRRCRRQGRPRPHPRPLRRGGERRSGRHPDGRQGPRLPGGDPERDPRRRRDPALPRLPRRRAHLRDGRPARRAQRPRRGRGKRDRADARPERAKHRPRRSPRRGRISRRGDRAPPSAPLPALLAPGPDRPRSRRSSRGSTRPRQGWLRRWPSDCRARPSCSGRRRCSASATATGAGSWSRPSSGRRASPPSA